MDDVKYQTKINSEIEVTSKLNIDRKNNLKFSKTGLFLAGATGGAALALSIICLPFVSPALRRICLPYVPATSAQVENVLSAFNGQSGRLVDLGSGDGRIVLNMAKAGFAADGVELNPWLVMYSKLQAYRLDLHKRTNFYCSDLWKFSLAQYSNLVIFGVQEMMPDLEAKFAVELRDGARVVACRFPLPTWVPHAVLGQGMDTVWVYQNTKPR